MNQSLLGKIVFRLTLTTLFAIVIAYGWLWYRFETTTAILHNRSLIEWAHAIASATTILSDGAVGLDLPLPMKDAFVNSNGAKRLAVRGKNGDVLHLIGGAVAPLPKVLDQSNDGTFYRFDPDGPGPVVNIGIAYSFLLDNIPLVVQIEETTNDHGLLIETLTVDFFEDGGWLAGPFLLALLGVSIITVRRSLSPLSKLSLQAESIGPGSMDIRLPENDVPREIMPLVQAVNRALERLEEGYRIQREFTANAAHEMRTPLAILGANIDTLADRDAARSLRADLDGMSRLMSQLLRAAQVEALTVEKSELTDLNVVAAEVASFLARMAVTSGKSIEVVEAPEPAYVHGNADSIFHALRNLVENALTQTLKGTEVSIRVTGEPSLEVVDQGPGVPPELREKIFQRFWRADHSRTGAGLGLAIVRRTMDMHGGRVDVSDAPHGGARFTLHFPKPLSASRQTDAG
jgi:signal transduction histidine kinase